MATSGQPELGEAFDSLFAFKLAPVGKTKLGSRLRPCLHSFILSAFHIRYEAERRAERRFFVLAMHHTTPRRTS